MGSFGLSLYFYLFARKPFKAMPGRLFGFAVIPLGWVIWDFYIKHGQSEGNPPLSVLIIVGIQSMSWMVGELVMRSYFESSNRKTYMVRDIVD